MGRRAGVALDVDGTLVDSVHHHAVCWQRAFAQLGHDVSAARAHRHVGMGGDQLVEALIGAEGEARDGDALRASHDALFAIDLPTVRPLPGARDLLVALAREGAPVVLASSASEDEVRHYLDLLDADDLVAGWTTADDVDATKPDGALLQVAWRTLGTEAAVMIGDSPWDVLAAQDAGMPAIGVDAAGFGCASLREAGAALVVDGLPDLLDRVHDEPFVQWRDGARSAV